MKYKTLYNIKVREKPSLDSEWKDYSTISNTLKAKAFKEEKPKATIMKDVEIDIKEIVDNFGKIGKDAYICLNDGAKQLAQEIK